MCPVSGGSLRFRVQSLEAHYVCMSSQRKLYTFVCTAMEVLYICVSSERKLYTFLFTVYSLRLKPVEALFFVCPVMESLYVVCLVCGGSITFVC